MSWFKQGSESNDDLEFKPDEFRKGITEDVNKKFDELKSEFNPVLQFIRQQQEDKTKAEEARQAEQERLRRESLQVKDEDYLLDPRNATRKEMQPLAENIMKLAAKQAKQDVLSDKEYYHGEIKEKVDSILARQPLDAQANPDIITNTYKIVMFDHQDKIQKGEIKSRASSMSFGNNGTGGHSAGNGEDNQETLSDEEKKAAARFGITEKDWIAQRKELQYV